MRPADVFLLSDVRDHRLSIGSAPVAGCGHQSRKVGANRRAKKNGPQQGPDVTRTAVREEEQHETQNVAAGFSASNDRT
jgi:hypothetical protein